MHIPGFSHESFSNIQALYNQYNFMIIFNAGFNPIPLKLFTISSGAFGINFQMFLMAGAISRTVSFMLVTFLIKLYVEPIKYFIDKYFNLLAILFAIILFGRFFLVKIIY